MTLILKHRAGLALLLALVLCFQFVVPVLPAAAEEPATSGFCGFEGDGKKIAWSLEDDLLLFTGSGEIKSEPFDEAQRAYLAQRVKYAVVSEGIFNIPSGLFKDFPLLCSVSIAESVIYIGDEAFSGCTALATIKLPAALWNIGREAFAGCTALTEVRIPDAVTSLGTSIFDGCTALASVTLPAKGYLREYMFQNCTSLKEIVLPETVTTIPSYAFNGCSSLTSVTLPSFIGSIGMSAFGNCTSLTSLTLPDGLLAIGSTAFFGCTALKELVLPDTVNSIGNGAFEGCTALEEIQVPASVTTLLHSTFRKCTALHTVYLPASLSTINYLVFDGCDALKDVYYDGVQEAWERIKIEKDFNDPLFAATIHFSVSITSIFPDVKKSDWFFSAVDFAYRNQLMVGNERGFEPNATLTRAMIAQILCNVEGPATTDGRDLFSDVKRSDWYGFAVDWAGFCGLISGQPDGTFAPNRNATREELISIIYRYAQFKGMDVSSGEDPTALNAFADADSVSSWARTAMQWACSEGILSGKPGKLIDPKGTATRAETAQIFKNLLS